MADPLLPDDPTRIGAYTLTGRLGEGGQGAVYLGRDAGGRQVAVKLLHARLSRDPAARSRFVRELEVAQRVAGFCTARVLDADIDGNRPYIVSEFVSGPSLAALVRDEGPMDDSALLRLAIGTATALAAIHRAGIVHRDFRPQNVLMGAGGPRVIDFGIARALGDDTAIVTSQVVGTPAYMAPEQVAGGAIGPAADMFAWGGTLLFAATGRPPFGGDSVPAVMHRVLHAEADVGVLPGPLAEIVGACLAKAPERRPSAQDVLLRLLGLVGAHSPSGSGDPLQRGATLVTTRLTEVIQDVPAGPPPPQVSSPGTVPSPRRRRRRRRPALIAAVPLAASAIILPFAVAPLLRDGGTGGTGRSGGTDGGATVTVGFAGPLSGENAHLGRPMLAGARLAVAEYNARGPRVRARLVEYDTAAEEDKKVLATRIVNDETQALVGPALSGEAGEMAPTLEENDVPSVSPGASNESLSTYGWRYWHSVVPDTDASAVALADLALRSGAPGGVMVIDDGTLYARKNADAFQDRLESGSVKVLRERVPEQARDFSAVVREMKRSGVGAVFYGGVYTEAAPLIKQARREGVRARFYLTDGSFDPELTTLAGTAAEDAVLTCSCLNAGASAEAAPPRYADFQQRYAKANGGAQPEMFAAEGYDAANAVLDALAAGKRTGEEINAHLGSMDREG
ncbi:bifunctional serine/threonine-protein kinase/ABC transporter substrate-binding protein [Actinomadura keratinilytica]